MMYSAPNLLIALILAAIRGPVEEIGWRGVALPLLQRKFRPIWAGLIISIIVTQLFNDSQGSIFWAALFHYVLMNPVFLGAEPCYTYILVLLDPIIVWPKRATLPGS